MNFRLAIELGFNLAWRLVWTSFSMSCVIIPILFYMHYWSSDSMQGWLLLIISMVCMLVPWLAVCNVLIKIDRRRPELFHRVYMPLLLGRNIGEGEIELVRTDRKTVKPLFLSLMALAVIALIWHPSNEFADLLFELLVVTVLLSLFLQGRYKKYPGLVDVETVETLLAKKSDKKNKVLNFFAGLCEPVIYSIPVLIVFLLLNLVPLPLSPEEKAFFEYKAEAHPEENGFYAVLGLGSNSDPHQAGLQIASQLRAGKTVDFGKPLLSADLAKINDARKYPIVCKEHDLKRADCFSLTEWKSIIDENKDVLFRYEKLYRYKYFETPLDINKYIDPDPSSPDVSPVRKELNTFSNRLMQLKSIEQLVKAYSGEPEQALVGWLDDNKFKRDILASEGFNSVVSFAVYTNDYRKSISDLFYILRKDPSLIQKYNKDILASFIYLNPGDIDFKKLLENEARIFQMEDESFVESMLPTYLSFLADSSNNISADKGYTLLQETKKALDIKDIKQRKIALDSVRQEYSLDSARYIVLKSPSDLLRPLVSGISTNFVSGLVSSYDTELVGDSYYTICTSSDNFGHRV